MKLWRKFHNWLKSFDYVEKPEAARHPRVRASRSHLTLNQYEEEFCNYAAGGFDAKELADIMEISLPVAREWLKKNKIQARVEQLRAAIIPSAQRQTAAEDSPECGA